MGWGQTHATLGGSLPQGHGLNAAFDQGGYLPLCPL